MGGPTFFDVSICSSLQPGNITNAVYNAGAAAAAGEALKDEKHQTSVEASGGSFIPLVVESLGVWTPFAKKSLKSIATRSSLGRGLSVLQAYNLLLQQLSIQLWAYNAKMIRHRLSTLPLPP